MTVSLYKLKYNRPCLALVVKIFCKNIDPKIALFHHNIKTC